MKFANATNFHRKSGVAQWRDLLFSFFSVGANLRVVPTDDSLVGWKYRCVPKLRTI